MTTTDRAVQELKTSLDAALDRLTYTDPVSPLYSHERGYIAGLRSALAVLGVDLDTLSTTPPRPIPRELRRHPDQTDQLAAIGDTHA